MLPASCVVRTYRELFTPAAVRAYRHYGVVLVEHFLDSPTVAQLAAACNSAVQQRGDAIFPGIDPQHQHGATQKVEANMQPKAVPGATRMDAGASAGAAPEFQFGSGPLPAEAVQQASEMDRERRVDFATRKVHMKLKNQRAVDRAFRRLTRARDRYNKYKNLRQYVSHEEEMAGEMSDARINEIRQQVSFDDLKRSFQKYRDGGALESEIRHEHHINDATRFMHNWPRTWCWLWSTSPELAALATRADGAVGRQVGHAAGHLSGEIVLRVFSDSATQEGPLTNAATMGFAGAGMNTAHPHGLCVQIGVSADSCVSPVVMPGSHHVVRQISHDGRELDRFVTGGVFDVGSIVRRLPEVRHLPMVAVPPLRPGSALFFNNYLIMGTQPTLTGAASCARGTVMATPFSHVANYGLSLLPDRCVFDGERNSWASRDSHGPLFAYKRGDLLTDDSKFPVIHRALDIE